MINYFFTSMYGSESVLESGGRTVFEGSKNMPVEMIHPDRIMTMHDLIYIVSGEWEIWQDETPYRLKAGDMLLLFAGNHHYGTVPSSSDIVTYYIHFKRLPADRALMDKNVTPNRNVYSFPAMMTIPQSSAFPQLMERAVSCYWARDIYSQNRASAYLELLLCELSAIHAGDTARANAAELVERLTMSMRLNPQRFYSVAELAAMIRVSPKTLYNYFMREKGVPPHEYQLARKLENAEAELIRKPEITLRELAARYGFCDEYHFAKCYKSHFGRPPKQQR